MSGAGSDADGLWGAALASSVTARYRNFQIESTCETQPA